MSRILNLQKLQEVGSMRASMMQDAEASTCSYIGCGNSTASCVGCCTGTCDKNTTKF